MKGLLLLYLLTAVPAQTVNAVVEKSFSDSNLSRFIDMGQGLPVSFVDDVWFDESGFMWIATAGGGLCRYDGYDMLYFSTTTQPRLRSNFIRNITGDGFGRMWMATEAGIEILDLKDYSIIKPDDMHARLQELFGESVCSYVTTAADGAVWAKTGNVLARIEFTPDGAVDHISALSDYRLQPLNMVFEDVDEDGSVWICLDGDIYKVAENKDKLLHIQDVYDGVSFGGSTLVTDYLVRDNEVWISSIEGLMRLDRSRRQWRIYTHEPGNSHSLSQNYISGLAETPDKRLVAISLRGINVYNALEDDFERISCDDNSDGSGLLSSNFINCVAVRENDLWLGTESAGLIQISPRRLDVTNYRYSQNNVSSIAQNPVNAVFEDNQGIVWVGNVEGGLSYTAHLDDGFRHITAGTGQLSHNSVSAITQTPDGRLWVGTWGGGVDVLMPGSSVKRVGKPVWKGRGAADVLDYVGAMTVDTLNELVWIGTNSGVFYCDMNTYEVFPALDIQTSGCIGACIDNVGRLWMGSQEGVYVFDLDSRDRNKSAVAFQFRNYRYKLDDPDSKTIEKMACIRQASDGTIWLGSNGNGLYRLDSNESGEPVFRNLNVSDGLANNCVKCIEEDELGNLWISTANGLSRFSSHDYSFTSFYHDDGLESVQFYLNASCRLSNGNICFGSVDGLSVIDVEQSRYGEPDYGIRMASVAVGGETDYNPGVGLLKLHERDRSIVFSFSALHYGTASSVRYSCRMDGFDYKWIDLPVGENFMVYASLPAGSYTLQVKAVSESGRKVDILELPIRVKPYYYHTMFFRLLMSFIIASLVIIWSNRRMRFLERQKELLQKKVDERTREIREQNKLIERKAEELDRQNELLKRQVEELAGNRLIIEQESRQSDAPADDQFKNRVLEILKSFYRNPDLDVAMFCNEIGMSKTQLNKKLQDSFGHSVVGIIRAYRLSVAKGMIMNNRETGSLNISEIAYDCGFNDPKYFSRCFTNEFGVAPSAIKESV